MQEVSWECIRRQSLTKMAVTVGFYKDGEAVHLCFRQCVFSQIPFPPPSVQGIQGRGELIGLGLIEVGGAGDCDSSFVFANR